MFKCWLAGCLFLLFPVAACADETAVTVPPLTALVLITLFASLAIQLWQYPDVLNSPYRKPILLMFLAGVVLALLWSKFTAAHTGLSLLGFAAILTGSQLLISHWMRQAGFRAVKSLVLQELALKTTSLQEKSLELKEKNIELKEARRALHTAKLELQALSFTDPLTGACNRLYFDRQFLLEWQKARREHQPLSLVLVDIDHFKALNDQYGELAGEEVLQRVAQLLQQGFRRGTDIIARFGHEEFVILLPNTLPANALALAEKVRQSIARQPLAHQGHAMNLTASFGVGGLIPQPQHDPLGLLSATDQALNRVKRHGRNGCHLAAHYAGTLQPPKPTPQTPKSTPRPTSTSR